MPRPTFTASQELSNSREAGPFFIGFCVLFLLCIFTCAALGIRPVPTRHLTDDELEAARLRKEEERELRIKEQLARLERRLKGTRVRKAVVEATHETARLLDERAEEWDAKGRVVYGDAWDESVDGNLPMRELFSLPAEEVREAKIEAYNTVAKRRGQVDDVERVERETARRMEEAAVNTARLNVKEGRPDGKGEDVALALLDKRRKARPATDAPFYDPRFVSRSSLPLTFTAPFTPRDPAPPSAPPNTASVPTPNPLNHSINISALPSQPAASSFRSEASAAPPPPRVERQRPGLKNPAPPSFSPPPANGSGAAAAPPASSAFRSEPNAPPAPRVERQQPGLKNPKPPSFEPPPIRSQAGAGDGGVSEGDIVVDLMMKKKGI